MRDIKKNKVGEMSKQVETENHKYIVAIVGDTHIGHAFGLSTPEYVANTEDRKIQEVRKANKVQLWLYECWLDYWDYVKQVAKDNKASIITVHMGDVIENKHHEGTEIVLPKTADQIQIALDLLQPVVDISTQMFICKGTSIHTGYAQVEAGIAKALGAEYDWEYNLNINGLLCYFTHHGRVGARPWTSQGSIVGAQIILDRVKNGEPIPRYVFTAHNHRIDDSGERLRNLRVVGCPSWQIRYSYVMHINPFEKSAIGGLIVVDDKIDFTKSSYIPEPQYKEYKIK